jgi:hypothetical protein
VRGGPAALAILLAAAATAAAPTESLADPDAPARRIHGSAGAGGALLFTGDRGDRARAELAVDVKLGGRFGVLAAWRAHDLAEERYGLVTAGVVFEAGAARPRLVLDLHADAGAELDARAPVIGGGIRTTLAITGPLGVVLDAGAYLVLDGFDDTRLQLQSSALLAVRW